MRSISEGGILSVFAVVMNITLETQLKSLMFGPAFDSIGSFPDSMFQTEQ